MSKTDSSLEPRLQNAPTYQAALRGQWFAPGMPQTPGFRVEHLRAAAKADGIEIPSGYAFKDGRFQDANQDRWYSDPRVLGPIAVAATGSVGGLLGGASSAAPALGNVNATIDALSGAGAGAGAGAGSTAASGGIAGLKAALTNPGKLAGLAAATVPAFLGASGAGSGTGDPKELNAQIQRMLAQQEQRVTQAQPIYDTLVNMAYGMSPTAYRGQAPAGYTAPAEPSGAYKFQPPVFGVR